MPNDPIAALTAESIQKIAPPTLRKMGDACFLAGFASIAANIVAWGIKKGGDFDAKAERFGIFIGLWAPTFFILSDRFERYAKRAGEKED